MKENNNIYLAGGDALVNLAKSMHKNIPQHLFGAIHLVRAYLMTDFSTSLPPFTHLYTCWMSPAPSIPPAAYVLNG